MMGLLCVQKQWRQSHKFFYRMWDREIDAHADGTWKTKWLHLISKLCLVFLGSLLYFMSVVHLSKILNRSTIDYSDCNQQCYEAEAEIECVIDEENKNTICITCYIICICFGLWHQQRKHNETSDISPCDRPHNAFKEHNVPQERERIYLDTKVT